MKKIISTTAAPAAIGPYSQGVDGGSVVITSGQLPIDVSTGAFAEGGVAGQTRQSLENVKAILAQAGLGMRIRTLQTTFETNAMLGYIILIGIIGTLLNSLVNFIERRLTSWQEKREEA